MKEFYGMSYNQRLLNLRIEIASSLLTETDLPAKDISYKVGFSDYSHFYKLFVNHHQLSPSKYREMFKHRE